MTRRAVTDRADLSSVPAATALAARCYGLHCVSRDPKEPAGPDFLAVCDDTPVAIIPSIHCPPECGGHPVCGPCLALARRKGMLR